MHNSKGYGNPDFSVALFFYLKTNGKYKSRPKSRC